MRRADGATERDRVAVEEPLEIRVGGHRVSVTMRTPGHDFELAAGFLVTEGLVAARDLGVIEYCPDSDDNIVDVRLVEGAGFDPELLRRNFYATSSCGICGAASIELVRKRVAPLSRLDLAHDVLVAMPEKMRAAQKTFDQTGGLHAAALFRDGELVLVREDVGRHNAVDKIVGASALRDSALAGHALLVSGRASFEIVQKAAVAGIAAVAAVGAPSSLAVEFAREVGMTLVGFLRGDRYNVYA